MGKFFQALYISRCALSRFCCCRRQAKGECAFHLDHQTEEGYSGEVGQEGATVMACIAYSATVMAYMHAMQA